MVAKVKTALAYTNLKRKINFAKLSRQVPKKYHLYTQNYTCAMWKIQHSVLFIEFLLCFAQFCAALCCISFFFQSSTLHLVFPRAIQNTVNFKLQAVVYTVGIRIYACIKLFWRLRLQSSMHKGCSYDWPILWVQLIGPNWLKENIFCIILFANWSIL